MRKAGKKQAIRNGLYRLGMHARAKEVVHALARHGILVDEELVRLVRIEMLKETTGGRLTEVSRPVTSPVLRRCPKGFPRRQGHG